MNIPALGILPARNTFRADGIGGGTVEIAGVGIEVGITSQDLAPIVDKELVSMVARWNGGLVYPVPVGSPVKLKTRAATENRLLFGVTGNAKRCVCGRDMKRLRKFIRP